MSTLTITEFLLARIAEDEAVAQAVEDGPRWAVDEESYVVMSGDDGICYDVASGEVSQHIARHDPARVLAECAAKAIMIGVYRAMAANHPKDGSIGWYQVECYMTVIRTLAAVYKDHAEYQPEWAL